MGGGLGLSNEVCVRLIIGLKLGSLVFFLTIAHPQNRIMKE